ncbi:hypothetical protein B0H11DRAFT_1907335 [Mycena galericulata]|nr:hypothetical protein B0H11DRAFT_1907335 [Mycena galericulata]
MGQEDFYASLAHCAMPPKPAEIWGAFHTSDDKPNGSHHRATHWRWCSGRLKVLIMESTLNKTLNYNTVKNGPFTRFMVIPDTMMDSSQFWPSQELSAPVLSTNWDGMFMPGPVVYMMQLDVAEMPQSSYDRSKNFGFILGHSRWLNNWSSPLGVLGTSGCEAAHLPKRGTWARLCAASACRGGTFLELGTSSWRAQLFIQK